MKFSYPVANDVLILITVNLGTLGYIHWSQGTGWRALTSALSFNCGKFWGEQTSASDRQDAETATTTTTITNYYFLHSKWKSPLTLLNPTHALI